MARKTWSIRGLTLVLAVALLLLYGYVIKPYAPASLPEWVPIAVLVVLWISAGIALQLWDINRFNRMAAELGLSRIPEAESHTELSPRTHRGSYRDRTVMVDLKIPQTNKYARTRFFAEIKNDSKAPRLVVQRRGGPGTGGKDLPPGVDVQSAGLNNDWQVYCKHSDVARSAFTTETCAALSRVPDLVEIDTVGDWLRGEVHDRVIDPDETRILLDAVTALAKGFECSLKR